MAPHFTRRSGVLNNTKFNNMAREFKKLSPAWILLPIIIMMLGYSANRFLNTESTYSSYTKTYTISGWDAVALVPHFWLIVWIGVILSVFLFITAALNETGAWIGKKWRGEMGVTILLCIMALLVLVLPWLRGMEAKVDGGATLPQNSQLYESPGHSSKVSMAPHWSSITLSTDGVLSQGQCSSRSYTAGQEIKMEVACCGRCYSHMDGHYSRFFMGTTLGSLNGCYHLVSV